MEYRLQHCYFLLSWIGLLCFSCKLFWNPYKHPCSRKSNLEFLFPSDRIFSFSFLLVQVTVAVLSVALYRCIDGWSNVQWKYGYQMLLSIQNKPFLCGTNAQLRTREKKFYNFNQHIIILYYACVRIVICIYCLIINIPSF